MQFQSNLFQVKIPGAIASTPRLVKTLAIGLLTTAVVGLGTTLPSWAQDAILRASDSGARINLRQSPSTTARNLGYGLVGDRVTVLDQAPSSDGITWYRVRFPRSNAVGWIRGDFIQLASSSQRTGVLTATDTGSQINLRQAPNPASRNLGYGIVGDRVSILEETPGSDGYVWYRVRFPRSGAVGWIRGTFVRVVS